MYAYIYNENSIKIRDMRVDFYTSDVRNIGQAQRARRRERTDIQ